MAERVDVALSVPDLAASDAIRQALETFAADEVYVSERRGLDGSTAQWMVIAVLGPGGVKPFLDFILDVIKLHRVDKLTMGETTIDHLQPADIERLLAAYESRAPDPS